MSVASERIEADQAKTIVGREIVKQHNGLSLEIVTFRLAADDTLAYGGRVFGDSQSTTSVYLYGTKDAAIDAVQAILYAEDE